MAKNPTKGFTLDQLKKASDKAEKANGKKMLQLFYLK